MREQSLQIPKIMQSNVESSLFSSYKLGELLLQNRIVMAPMTRCRATGNVANNLMSQYYKERASAGLIITEGTAVSEKGLGYSNMPGIFNAKQIDAWRKITDAVHAHGGKIFVQLQHTGRIGYLENLPKGKEIIGPSSIEVRDVRSRIACPHGEYVRPRAMIKADINITIKEYRQAALNSMKAGFDGVEIDAAYESLVEQFLSSSSNLRIDEYGSSVVNRCRFALDIANEVGDAIGFNKLGFSISPFEINSWKWSDITQNTFNYLSVELNKLGILYIQLHDKECCNTNSERLAMKELIRKNFKGSIILTGGMDKYAANAHINLKLADIIGFGRLFISNHDLVVRFRNNMEINSSWSPQTYFKGGRIGYTNI